jgi:hypothetical protein
MRLLLETCGWRGAQQLLASIVVVIVERLQAREADG